MVYLFNHNAPTPYFGEFTSFDLAATAALQSAGVSDEVISAGTSPLAVFKDIQELSETMNNYEIVDEVDYRYLTGNYLHPGTEIMRTYLHTGETKKLYSHEWISGLENATDEYKSELTMELREKGIAERDGYHFRVVGK